MILRVGFVAGVMLACSAAFAAEIFDDFPASIDPAGRYVIYSHGLIVEGDDPEPVHPEFGTYEFPAIKRALFGDGEFNLIAHHRPANTDIGEYIAKLESWVQALLDAGVAPSRITLVGFSRGAGLTVVAASKFAEAGINTALMGVCVDGAIQGAPDLQLGGNLLSIYEETDVVKSCAGLAQHSTGLESFREIAINTGRRHGAFYKPLPDWMTPLRAWIAQTNH